MFLKNNKKSSAPKQQAAKKTSIPTIVTREMNILGNVISDGVVDFDGTLDGNIRCHSLTVRTDGSIKGEVTADTVAIYGKVNGLIRARHVQLHAGCRIEGVVMHESLSIEDGAFIDGKCKRTDKVHLDPDTDAEDEGETGNFKMLENIRLIN